MKAKRDYELPEGFDAEMADGNELLTWWANTAFENGYSNEEFQEGINMYMNALNADVPDYDAELAKLGDNASARTEAVSLFANQFFSEDHLWKTCVKMGHLEQASLLHRQMKMS